MLNYVIHILVMAEFVVMQYLGENPSFSVIRCTSDQTDCLFAPGAVSSAPIGKY